MDHVLRPYTDEMWASLEEMNVDVASSSSVSSSSSQCSTCPSPLPPLEVISPEPEPLEPTTTKASEPSSSSSSLISNSNFTPTITSTNRDHVGSPSSRSTSSPSRRLGRVGAAQALVPNNKPELQPEIDPRHLVPLHTLATIATCSPDSLQRLTTQNKKKELVEDDDDKGHQHHYRSVTDYHGRDNGQDEDGDGDHDKASEVKEEENDEEGSTSGIRYSPQPEHHARSPRSYTIHQAYLDAKKQPQKGQREAMPRTSRATHHHREVVSPTRRRKPSPAASPSPGPRPRALSLSQSSQSQLSQTPSRSQPSQPQASSINVVLLSHTPKSSSASSSSTTTIAQQTRPQQDIIIRYPQGKSSRRPALDISSERLLSSLRNQLKNGEFPPYTMPHPKRDGAVSGKKWRCTYELEEGDRCNAACSRKGEARRHAFTHEIHLRWICPSLSSKTSSCGKLFARQDAAIRHVEQSRSCKDLAANRTEGFPVLVWEEEDEIVAKIVTLVWNEDEVEGEE